MRKNQLQKALKNISTLLFKKDSFDIEAVKKFLDTKEMKARKPDDDISFAEFADYLEENNPDLWKTILSQLNPTSKGKSAVFFRDWITADKKAKVEKLPSSSLEQIPHQVVKSLYVALLRMVETPKFIVNLPSTWWTTPLSKKADTTVGSYLTSKDKEALSQTSRSFYSLYKGEFTNMRPQIYTLFNVENDQPYNADDLKRLLSHVALGEFEQAEKIWKKDPALLTRCGTVYHPNCIYDKEGKVITDIQVWQNPGRYKYKDCTTWQIALMNSEFEEAEEMGKFMTQEEKEQQFAEIFPSGKIEKYDWDLEKAKQLLEAVFDAVIKDSTIDENNLEKMSDLTRTALQELYDYVKPAKEHKKGLVFDENFYVAALELYENRFAKFDQSNKWDQRSFWCIRIEEYLASLLGTAYLRPHAQGIGNVNVNDNKSLKRDGCKLADGASYFAFRRSSDSIPAVHHFVGYYGGLAGVPPWGGRDFFSVFKTYVKQKREQGQNYAAVFARCSTVSNLLK